MPITENDLRAHAASTPIDPEVAQRILRRIERSPAGNPIGEPRFTHPRSRDSSVMRPPAAQTSPPIRPFGRVRRFGPIVALPAAALITAAVVLAASALAPDGKDGNAQAGMLAPPQDSGIPWRWIFSIDSPPAGWRQLMEAIHSDHQEATLLGPTGAVCNIQVFAAGIYDTSRIRADATPVKVNGIEGTFAPTTKLAKDAVPAVSWQYAPGAYAVSFCPQDSVDVRSDALTVASALTAHQRPFTMPFKVGYLPAGQVPDQAFSDSEPGYERGFVGVTGLSTGISLDSGDADPRNLVGAETLTVSTPDGPRDAAFREGMLMVFYAGFQVWIGEASPTISRDELIRIAENLTIAPNPSDPSTWFDAQDALP